MKQKAYSGSQSHYYDVVVIGGGAAGMMAAATAAAAGASTLLLEKNQRLGKKLSITGGGRCNVTNNKPQVREMLSAYQGAGKFLFSTYMQFGVTEMIAWLTERGVSVHEENEGRLFPDTNDAETICATLENELLQQQVTVHRAVIVRSVEAGIENDRILIKTNIGPFAAGSCIIATGGMARPDTGSTGDGFAWLQALGHTIVPNSNTLVPVLLTETWPAALSGLAVADAQVTVWSDKKKERSVRGRLLFTHTGVSGPLILNLSQYIGDQLQYSSVTLTLNLYPEHDAGSLKQHLRTMLASNKKLLNILAADLPRQLVRALLEQLAIDGETPGHSVRTAERARLLTCLQAVPLSVKGVGGADTAVASAGGVALTEIDWRTMASRCVARVYVVGDVLNINRPSGGYSLQLCWSTGYVAGQAAAKYVREAVRSSGKKAAANS